MEKWRVPLAFLAGIVVAIAGIRLIRLVDEFVPCDYEIVREFPSPNKRVTAIVILSGCMLAPYVSSVAIKLDGEDFRFDNRDSYLFDVKHKNGIEVQWIAMMPSPSFMPSRS
jgi:hypothetical protein